MPRPDPRAAAGVSALDVPAPWEHSAARILRNHWRKILVLGAMDRGKSTYCAFLAARLARARHRVALVDADVGQKDIGPPATITLGDVPAPHGESIVSPRAYYFVGSTTPMGHMLPMLAGTRRMLDAAAAADFVIIDTTGFIHGAGHSLKTHKIEIVQPDVIVALAAGTELDALLRAHRNERIVRLRPSRRARTKSTQERTQNRERAFRHHFVHAAELHVPFGGIIIQRSLLFTGEPFGDPRYVYAERTAEGIVAVSATRPADRRVVKWLRQGFERNLLCGVADRHGNGLGLAIIREINFRAATIALVTPVPRRPIAVLQLGRMYVSPDGTERGRAHV